MRVDVNQWIELFRLRGCSCYIFAMYRDTDSTHSEIHSGINSDVRAGVPVSARIRTEHAGQTLDLRAEQSSSNPRIAVLQSKKHR